MAGYSKTPLAKKLGIRAGSAVAMIDAPAGLAETLAPLPEAVRLYSDALLPARTVLLFARSHAALAAGFESAAACVEIRGHLWVAWPKRASGVVTDLTEDGVRQHGLARVWVDFKVCAIDDIWSGLCFARR